MSHGASEPHAIASFLILMQSHFPFHEQSDQICPSWAEKIEDEAQGKNFKLKISLFAVQRKFLICKLFYPILYETK